MNVLRRYLLLALAGLALAVAAWAQDNESPAGGDEAASGSTAAETAASEDAEDEDAIEIDDESYIDIEEDDFRPSEEIDADQSIPFPTDI